MPPGPVFKESDELKVFDTAYGRIGILFCSEAWVPELSRILALKGAEIIFYPTGMGLAEMIPAWRNIIAARGPVKTSFIRRPVYT